MSKNTAKAQLADTHAQFRGDTNAISSARYYGDTSVNIGQIFYSKQQNVYVGFRAEAGTANIEKYKYSLSFSIGIGSLFIQGDYRSYGGDPRQNNTPATPWDVLLAGWAFNGSARTSSIPDLPTTLDGIDEFSLTTGKIYSYLHGTILLMPSIGLAAVSRNIVHYHNCQQVTQPGQDIIFLLPAGEDDKSWYQYTTTVESQVCITIPLSLHAVMKFTSWIGLSITGWTQIGNGGTSGISAGLEIGALP